MNTLSVQSGVVSFTNPLAAGSEAGNLSKSGDATQSNLCKNPPHFPAVLSCQSSLTKSRESSLRNRRKFSLWTKMIFRVNQTSLVSHKGSSAHHHQNLGYIPCVVDNLLIDINFLA